MSENKLNLFDVIKRVQKNDIAYIRNLNEEDIKSVPPVLLLKWLGNSNISSQIKCLNFVANKVIFKLYKHPKLLYNILVSSVNKNSERIKWNKRPSKKSCTNLEILISEYYNCTISQARDRLLILNKNEILDILEMCGKDKEFIKKVKKEL